MFRAFSLTRDNLCEALDTKGGGEKDEEDLTWFVGVVWLRVLGTRALPYIRRIRDTICMGLGIQRTPSILVPFSSTSGPNFRRHALTSAFLAWVWTRTSLHSSRILIYWPGAMCCSLSFISLPIPVRLCFLPCFCLDPHLSSVAFFVTCILYTPCFSLRAGCLHRCIA